VDGFRAELFPKPIGKNRHPLAIVVWEIFKKTEGGGSQNSDFLGFFAAVFSSTASSKNNLFIFN
jgi:hypothetical protein